MPEAYAAVRRDRGGKRLHVAAIVRRDAALTAEALDRFCLDSPDLADFKRPRLYFFIDEIPANPTGKVERGTLKEQLMQRIGGRELD